MTLDVLVERDPVRIPADPARVVAQLFVPGHAFEGAGEGRASGIVERLLALSDTEVDALLADLYDRFDHRHRDLAGAFDQHAHRIDNRLASGVELSPARRRLLGATFTSEVSTQAAALCNPSMVPHPDQSGCAAGSMRFVMSVRQIGEGHRSSVGFRTGVLHADRSITHDRPSAFSTVGEVTSGELRTESFGPGRIFLQDGREATSWVLEGLGAAFSAADLEARLAELESQQDTRRNVPATVAHLRDRAARCYRRDFPAVTDLSERVLYPATTFESNGIEDARFVRFVDDDGTVDHRATYTAYDGSHISQQVVRTADFRSFHTSPLVGPAAANKGLALFPRRIAGRFAALSRYDGARNAIAFSDDGTEWVSAGLLPDRPAAWETVQAGNCGPPIETDDGWLVLTHGVGPMRTYALGAVLLDLADPSVVVAGLAEPLLTPSRDERDGYVPNVVYSCGGMRNGDTLVVPFGIADTSIGCATVSITELIAAMA